MDIEIKLTVKEKTSVTTFSIQLDRLEAAMKDTYLDLGTPYRPIAVDNFIDIKKDVFPEIAGATKISISLKKSATKGSLFKEPKLVCCKAKNVGKDFINRDKDLKAHWNKIFNFPDEQPELLQCTPDGTLYISPIEKDTCKIETKDSVNNNYISYSILFSMRIKNKKRPKRRYYFNLDPLVKISSRG